MERLLLIEKFDAPNCAVGIEACVTVHHGAREMTAIGHDVRLIPEARAKPNVKHGKTDPVVPKAIYCCDVEGAEGLFSIHRMR
jgi:transposase